MNKKPSSYFAYEQKKNSSYFAYEQKIPVPNWWSASPSPIKWSIISWLDKVSLPSHLPFCTPTRSIPYFNILSTKSLVHFSLPWSFQIISRVARPCVLLLNNLLYSARFLASRQTPPPKLEDHSWSAVECLFNIFHIWRPTLPSAKRGNMGCRANPRRGHHGSRRQYNYLPRYIVSFRIRPNIFHTVTSRYFYISLLFCC